MLLIMIWAFIVLFLFFFMQKTEYELHISDWSSDVCSSDLSIHAVIETLLEALLLVVIVVVLFLQTCRAALIPVIAVPVAIIGSSAALSAFGFSLNTLTLFGLVLAVCLVVADAIVVLEKIARGIANGLTPPAAAHRPLHDTPS